MLQDAYLMGLIQGFENQTGPAGRTGPTVTH